MELGKTHYKLNLLRTVDGEDIYAVVAPVIAWDAIKEDVIAGIDNDPPEDAWHDSKLTEGSFQHCLDWLKALHEYG